MTRRRDDPAAVGNRVLAGFLWLALLAWACGVLLVSTLTPQQLPDAAFLLSDKISHVIAYAVGGWLAASALRVSWPRAAVARQIVLAVVVVAVFGAADEWVQTLTPGRYGGDVHDWLADVVGAFAGAMLSVPTHRRLARFRWPTSGSY